MAKFFRGTDNQIGNIPEDLNVNTKSSWKSIRKNIRKAIGSLFESWHFTDDVSEENLKLMKKWKAPLVKEGQAVWGSKRYELHHKKPKHNWWTNDIKNIIAATPRFHKDGFLNKDYHYKKK